jgi:hypothetical protein
MPIYLVYMAGLLQVRKIGGNLLICSNISGGKACHQGPHLSSLSSILRVEAEMVLANQKIKSVEIVTKIEDANTACSTFKVRGLGGGLLERGDERSLIAGAMRVKYQWTEGPQGGSATGPGQYQVAH